MNDVDNYGYTALHHAAALGKSNIALMLVKAGAGALTELFERILRYSDPLIKNIKEETPAMVAMIMRKDETASLIYELIEKKDPDSISPSVQDSKKVNLPNLSKVSFFYQYN